MKAIGMYIFGGSQTIGHLLEGWDIDTILEMTNDMKDTNSYHFVKNYPNIELKLPKDTTKEYIDTLKDKYDLLFANPPCSGLSTINRHASVDNAVNIHIYEVVNIINTIQPKTFLIENAPTLTSKGLPILKNISEKLNESYRLLIINDKACNHNVPMYRRRTFVVGFNKKYFNGLPKVNRYYNEKITVEKILKNIDYTYNKEFVEDTDQSLFKFYHLIKPNQSIYEALAENNVDLTGLSKSTINSVNKLKYKIENNLNIWDKSPYRPAMNQLFPSLTSLTRIIHPIENRDLYIREYAAIMGYPKNFIFYPKECKINTIQCIAQGVPVNFIRYISKEIMHSFNTDEYLHGEVIYINQCNIDNVKEKIFYNIDEFLNTKSLVKYN